MNIPGLEVDPTKVSHNAFYALDLMIRGHIVVVLSVCSVDFLIIF